MATSYFKYIFSHGASFCLVVQYYFYHFERIGQFLHPIEAKIIHWYIVIGSFTDNDFTPRSCCVFCMYEDLSPWPCCRLSTRFPVQLLFYPPSFCWWDRSPHYGELCPPFLETSVHLLRTCTCGTTFPWFQFVKTDLFSFSNLGSWRKMLRTLLVILWWFLFDHKTQQLSSTKKFIFISISYLYSYLHFWDRKKNNGETIQSYDPHSWPLPPYLLLYLCSSVNMCIELPCTWYALWHFVLSKELFLFRQLLSDDTRSQLKKWWCTLW